MRREMENIRKVYLRQPAPDGFSAELDINVREILRYLGIQGRDPDPSTENLLLSVIEELSGTVLLREFHQSFPLNVIDDGRNTVDLSCFRTHSRSLSKNLRGCSEVIIFAATIGSGVDMLLRRYSRVSQSRALVMQAAAAGYIESWCDQLNDRLKEKAAMRGLYLRPRFSPGYGDFPLEAQREIFQALQVEKRVGIALTDSLLMLPTKSVTAVIGAGKENLSCALQGCEVCSKADCLYRRNRNL